MVYHLIRTGTDGAACVLAGTADTIPGGDQLVPEAEARDPNGRHFNCPLCHATLTGGRAHTSPPAAGSHG